MGDVSAYEAKRLLRIQQNQQMMQSLGILVAPRERKRRVSTRDENAPPVPPRRSARHKPATDEPLVDLESMSRPTRPRVTEYKPVKLPVVEERQITGKLSRQSSKQLDMDLGAFHDRWLGKQIWPKGKGTVMEAMCPQHLPMYPLMLGIQQWRNGLVLFVNVQGASGYDNTFTEVPAKDTSSERLAAVHFRWFAQHRQSEESPAIVRLVAAQTGDHELWIDGAAPPALRPDATTPPEPVLLFLRHVGGPYIYCGRLGYLGHLPESTPMEFRWQLLDVDKIQWSEVKQLLEDPDHQADDAVVETRPGSNATTQQ